MYLINILIFYLLGFNYNDTLLNAINFGVISGVSAFIVDYIKNKDKRSFFEAEFLKLQETRQEIIENNNLNLDLTICSPLRSLLL